MVKIKNYIDEKGFWTEQEPNNIDNETELEISSSVKFSGNIISSGLADLPLLIFLISAGPFEAYNSPMFHEIEYYDQIFPKSYTWYMGNDKSKKIIEQKIKYNSNKTPKQIIWNVFEKDGVTIKKTAIDTISYISGTVFEKSRQREVF